MIVTIFLMKKNLVISYTTKVTGPATGPADVKRPASIEIPISAKRLVGIKEPIGIKEPAGIKKPLVICYNHQY